MKKITATIGALALATGVAVAAAPSAEAFAPMASVVKKGSCVLIASDGKVSARADVAVDNLNRVHITAAPSGRSHRVGNFPGWEWYNYIPVRNDHAVNGVRQGGWALSGNNEVKTFSKKTVVKSVTQYWKVTNGVGRTVGYHGCTM